MPDRIVSDVIITRGAVALLAFELSEHPKGRHVSTSTATAAKKIAFLALTNPSLSQRHLCSAGQFLSYGRQRVYLSRCIVPCHALACLLKSQADPAKDGRSRLRVALGICIILTENIVHSHENL